MNADANTRNLLENPLVPVANEADARATARVLRAYSPGSLTVLHVVEKGGGVPDKTPVEQSEEIAAESFAAFRAVFPDADDHTVYARDVVGAIFDAAEAVEASAIVFRPRGGSRIVQTLSGDRSRKLVTKADRPVIALPRTPPDE